MPQPIELINIFLHIDTYLSSLVSVLGNWSYGILFLIIFAETGLVVAPFLPGDSLLFVAGTLAGSGYFNITILYITMLCAAILGDSVNYSIGHHLGKKVFAKENSKIFKKEYLEKTREFYKKHGSKAIILARFLPILRTFAPFVAGVGNMHYSLFITFNILGAFLWITLITFTGYYFGGLQIVQENFHYTVVLIIFTSLIPAVVEVIKYRRGLHLSKNQMKHANYSDVQKTIKKDVEHE